MESNGTNGMRATNRKIAWFSAAGLALLAAVTIYALTNSGNVDMREGEPAAAIGRSAGQNRLAASITVPAGTALAMILETTLTTRTAHPGDRFAARIATPVRISGTTVIPAGAVVTGHVALAQQPGETSGHGRMQLAYDTIRYGGRDYDLDTVSRIYEGNSGGGKDGAIIAVGAVGGGVELASGTRLEVSLDRALTLRPAATV